jgi:hypothetical protein
MMLLRMAMGMKGYGIYFGIVEILRESEGYKLPLNFEAIAFDLRESVEDIQNVVLNFNLFEIEENQSFFSKSLCSRMQHLDRIKLTRAKVAKQMHSKCSANALQMHSKCSANALQMHRSKVKESKVKEVKQSKDANTFLNELSSSAAFKGVDVPREFEKAKLWCEKNNRRLTERFFTNWLNRVEVSLVPTQTSTPSFQAQQTAEFERELKIRSERLKAEAQAGAISK